MSPVKKKRMIHRDHPDLRISQQCKLVKLSRSAFYYAPVGVSAEELDMMKKIDKAFTKYPFFGSRQLSAYLKRKGTPVGRHRVRRLMAKMGLEAICKRPNTSKAHPPASDLSVSFAEDEDRQAQSGLVFRHHIYTGKARVPLSCGDHGLGDAQSSELEIVQHDARRLLRRSFERGAGSIRPA